MITLSLVLALACVPSPPGEVAGDVDVLIIGGGPAGMAAAMEAGAAGASTLLLEREVQLGGAIGWAGGIPLMLFSGTPEQESEGIVDSPDRLLAEWPAFTGGDPADPWVSYFAEANVPEVYHWLADRGVFLVHPRADPSAGTTARVHEVEGGAAALVEVLSAGVPGTVRLEAEALDLLVENGRTAGVVWEDLATGERHETRARAVVLATGGFLRDLARVRQERPDLAEVPLTYGSWPGADGRGLALLEAAGAASENLQAVGLYAHGMADPDGSGEDLPVPFASFAMWVNADGERFVDESQTNSFFTGEAVASQPGGTAWATADADTARNAVIGFLDRGSAYTIDELVALGAAASAGDLADLAAPLGVSLASFTASTEHFNAFARGESADPWRTDPSRADELATPPYYSVPLSVAATKGFGGIDVDLAGRVLRIDGTILAGTYACGELTGMAGGSLVGDHGFTGSLSAVVLSGRVAGAAAAAESLTRE